MRRLLTFVVTMDIPGPEWLDQTQYFPEHAWGPTNPCFAGIVPWRLLDGFGDDDDETGAGATSFSLSRSPGKQNDMMLD